MTLKFKDEEEVGKSFLELIEIVINLRYVTKDWHEHYGAERVVIRKKWEKKADDYLADLSKKKKLQP